MEKESLQSEELNRVSGGQTLTSKEARCPACGWIALKNEAYRNGFLVQSEFDLCSKFRKVYKCPRCGYSWKEKV